MVDAAIIDTLGEHGGMNYYSHGLGQAMAEAGARVTILSPPSALHNDGSYTWREAFSGAYGKGNKLIRGARLLTSSVSAARYMRKAGIEWVIYHIFRADSRELLDIILAKRSGRKVACIIHDISRTDMRVERNQMQRVVAMSDQLVVHNAYSRDLLCKAVPEATAKLAVIAHGSFVGQFAQPGMEEARRALDLPAEGTILLFFGSQRREKGLDVALKALAPFRDHNDLTLLVAGKAKPADEAFYRAVAEANGVTGRVRFNFGHVPDAQIADYYRAASIAVLPYHRVYESGVALMAMSFGRGVIASDIPVFAALARESGAAITFAADDPDDLSRRIAQLLDGGIDAYGLGERAFAFAERERNWAVSGRAWAALLDGRTQS